MNCNDVRDQLVEVAGGGQSTAEVAKHVDSCAECAHTLNELRATMALLEEWQAPEPSPYFDVRLQARLREEQQKSRATWLDWFRKPVLGIAAALLLAAGIGLSEFSHFTNDTKPQVKAGGTIVAPRGTAVGDLQFLDKNSDILQNFDALDALDGTMDNGSEVN